MKFVSRGGHFFVAPTLGLGKSANADLGQFIDKFFLNFVLRAKVTLGVWPGAALSDKSAHLGMRQVISDGKCNRMR